MINEDAGYLFFGIVLLTWALYVFTTDYSLITDVIVSCFLFVGEIIGLKFLWG